MKLSKIYSNKPNFKIAKFNDGLNVVLGIVTQKYVRDRDTHNLGKSTLISIIDFLLLKDISGDGKHIFKKHSKRFADYVFFLEIKLNNEKYVTIRRSIDKSSKVSFKLHTSNNQNYVDCDTWDFEDVSIGSRNPDKNAKYILDSLLGFDVLAQYVYRQTINYFLRTQADYRNVFHLNKFVGKDINWKPFLFELLGFDGSCVYSKYELESSYIEHENLAKEIANKFSVNSAEIDKIKGLIEIREQDKEEIEKVIDEFDFYLKERGISKELVEELETEISRLNTIEYNLKFDIEKIKESLSVGMNFNLQEVEKVFNEVNIYFAEQLKKSYEQLIEFNTEITSERMKYLTESLAKKEMQIDMVNNRLAELNEERRKKLAFLQEKDSFKKFKSHQSDLIEIEREIADLKGQIDKIDVIKNIKDQLQSLHDDIVEVTDKIHNQVKGGNDNYKDIRLLFNQLLTKIINKKGILSISTNKKGNIEFNAEIADFNKDEITSQGDGNTYRKILCVCFDLALLIHYRHKSFYRFVYHDGSLESLDNRKKLNYLELVEEICAKNDLQIIITMIEDDIPTLENGKKYQFKESQIALVLTDEEGDVGRLFGMAF